MPLGVVSNTPIKIAAANGSGTLTFNGIKEPRELPEFTFAKRMMTEDYTRPSQNTPGWRVFGSLGSHANFLDLSLKLPFVSPAEYATLQGWYNARPGVVLISIDGGANRYFGLFKEDGLKAFTYSFNQREFYRLELEFSIIGTANTAFS